jgi:hypothetical protein
MRQSPSRSACVGDRSCFHSWSVLLSFVHCCVCLASPSCAHMVLGAVPGLHVRVQVTKQWQLAGVGSERAVCRA